MTVYSTPKTMASSCVLMLPDRGPVDGLALIRERYENMLEQRLDNEDAFKSEDGSLGSAIYKGPMSEAMAEPRGALRGDGVGRRVLHV